MRIKYFLIIIAIAGLLGLSSCTKEGQEEDVRMDSNIDSNLETGQISDEPIDQINENIELDKALAGYREEREKNIVEKNGLVESKLPSEETYGLNISKEEYRINLDTIELTKAYEAASTYVLDSLLIVPSTKMEVYMCVDPRILAIYEDEDKGVANGYDKSNIFVCEYLDESSTWQYLILVREKKGEDWKVIHSGNHYKE